MDLKNKAAGIFFTNGKEVLLLKRNDNTWGLPGGHMKVGETSLEAAKREAEEECGNVKGSKIDKLKEINKNKIWTTFFFKIKNKFKCKISNEHKDWKWFKINELNKINLHPNFKKNLNKHVEILNNHFNKISFKEWLNYHKGPS